jgi:large subunit ribosomal protein L22
MEVKAKLKNAITTPRKARLAIDLVRGKPVIEAISILSLTPQRAGKIVKKLLESAASNATHNYGINKDNLYIKSITAQDGLVMKRWMPRAHGHANPILKRRSHISVCLEEITKSEEVKAGRKSKMKTFSYEEVKKVMKEAEKAGKMVKDKQGVKAAEKPEINKGEMTPQKEIDSRPKFSRLGDTFKRLIHRTTKKG